MHRPLDLPDARGRLAAAIQFAFFASVCVCVCVCVVCMCVLVCKLHASWSVCVILLRVFVTYNIIHFKP